MYCVGYRRVLVVVVSSFSSDASRFKTKIRCERYKNPFISGTIGMQYTNTYPRL